MPSNIYIDKKTNLNKIHNSIIKEKEFQIFI